MTTTAIRFTEEMDQMDVDDSDVDDEMTAEEEEALKQYQKRTGAGRKSVSGERYNPESDDEDEPHRVIGKTDEQRKRLHLAASKVMLLNRLEEDQLSNVLDAMEERKVKEGEVVIKQGDDGDNFYVIDSGNYDIFIGEGDDAKKVGAYSGGGFFGELALMYNMPRAATIKATTDGILWSLDRKTFRQIIVKANANRRKQYEDFLKKVELLNTLSDAERSKIADVMESKKFKKDQVIITQGDHIDSSSLVYFMMDGTVSVTTQKEGEVKRLEGGSYFGELALITKEARKASITVVSDEVITGVLDVNAFERLLGPCRSLMERNIDKYAAELEKLSVSK
jgi:cAMP-dependent protein kinase regulator